MAKADPHRFVFDLDHALQAQVRERLDGSPRLPLAKDIGPRESGI